MTKKPKVCERCGCVHISENGREGWPCIEALKRSLTKAIKDYEMATTAPTDITGSGTVEVHVRHDGKVLWVNTAENGCVLRICRINKIYVQDDRPDYDLDKALRERDSWNKLANLEAKAARKYEKLLGKIYLSRPCPECDAKVGKPCNVVRGQRYPILVAPFKSTRYVFHRKRMKIPSKIPSWTFKR